MKLRLLRTAGLVLMAATVLQGCELLLSYLSPPVTASERMEMFEESLNSTDRTNTYQHLHTDMDNDQNYRDADFWEASIFRTANRDFTFTLDSPTVSGGITTFTGTLTNGFSGSFELTVQLKPDDETSDYLILYLEAVGSSTTFNLLQVH